MDCRWSRARVPAEVDGELPAEDRAAFEAHLAACPRCAAARRAEQQLAASVRAVAGAEKAPESLAERIHAGLAAQEAAERGGTVRTPSVRLSLRRLRWKALAAVAAAAAAVAAVLWLSPDRTLPILAAMAGEHYQHAAGQGEFRGLERVSEDQAELEKYLTEKLGLPVALPRQNVPEVRGACCARRGQRRMGLVACFCRKRGKAVTIFVLRAEGVAMAGLERLEARGQPAFWRGRSGRCCAVLWIRGELLYALAGELEPDDILGMARRAAAALEDRGGPPPSDQV